MAKRKEFIFLISILITFFSCSLNRKNMKNGKEIFIDKTTGIRKIEKTKDCLNVKIIINPKKDTTGIIIEEILPEGYSIISAEPNYSKKEDNVYKWLFWGKEINKIEINYKVKVKKNSKEKIKGYIKTLKEGTIEIKD